MDEIKKDLNNSFDLLLTMVSDKKELFVENLRASVMNALEKAYDIGQQTRDDDLK